MDETELGSDRPPLQPATQHLACDDVEETRLLFRDVFGFSVACDTTDTGPHRLGFKASIGTAAPITLAHFSFGAPTEIHAPGLQDSYAFSIAHRGSVVLQQRDTAVRLTPGDGKLCALQPDPAIHSWFPPHSTFFTAYVDQHVVARELEKELGRSVQQRLNIPSPELNTANAGLSLLASLIHLVGTEMQNPDGLTSRPQVAQRLGEAMVATMLHALPHQYSQALADTARPGPAPVLTVTDAMHADPAHPFTQKELADLAGIPLRTLQRAFRAHHGQSLMVYLRNLRLDRVHRDLHAEQPPGTTVAQIAGRWGFFHPSRFAAYYRQRYGTLPSHERQP